MALAWAAVAWIAGSVAAAIFGMAAWPLALGVAAGVLVTAILRDEARSVWYALALPAIFLAALLRFEMHDAAPAANDVAHYANGPEIRMRAILRDDPDIGDTSQRFAVSARELQLAGTWVPASGGVQVRTGLLPRYQSGDIIEVEGQLQLPPSEAGFDYADYLAQRDIRSTLSFGRIRVVGHDNDSVLRSGLLQVRRRLAHSLAVALPEPQASLAQGVLLGERSSLPPDLNDDLNATNTSHLVVVSGANVVLVSAFAASALTWVFGRRRALLLSIVAILGYMLLVGMSPPVVRGTIMGILLVISQVTGRRTNGLVSILIAAAVMIGVSPYAVHDVSFQLSFAATAGLVFLSGPIHDWMIAGLTRICRRDTMPSFVRSLFVAPVSMTIAAIVATEPLIALNFERISLVAVPANLLIVPVFGLILLSSTVAAIGGLIPHAHLLLAAPAYYSLTYWIVVAHWLASLPAALLTFTGYTSLWAVTSYAAITALAFVLLRRLGRPSDIHVDRPIEWRRFAPFALGAVPAAVLMGTAGFVFGPQEENQLLRVTMLDVGQGDAILIQTPSGVDILVDGGPGRAVLRGLGEELSWRDRSIEMVVLTHPQSDHLFGLLDVLDRYDVQRIIAGPGQGDALSMAQWSKDVDQEGLAIEHPKPGALFDLGDGVRLEVIGPTAAMASDPELNNTSLVIRLVWNDVSFLLTGDIESKAELDLLANGAELDSTVLKVGHHGSLTASSPEFLAAVSPEISVVSAGIDNQFQHPRPEIVQRLEEFGPVYTTSIDGAIVMETDGERLWISTSR